MSFALDGLQASQSAQALGDSQEVQNDKESWLQKMEELLDSQLAVPRWRECWELVLQGVDLKNWTWNEENDSYTLELDQCYKFTYQDDPVLYIPKRVIILIDPERQTLGFLGNHHTDPTGFVGAKEVGFWKWKTTVLGAALTTRYNEVDDVFETETLTSCMGFEYSRHKSYEDTLSTWRQGVKEGIGDELPEDLFPQLVT